jgi:hypothetical protein
MFSVYEPPTEQIAVSVCLVALEPPPEPQAATSSEAMPRNVTSAEMVTRLLPGRAREKEVEAIANLPTSER